MDREQKIALLQKIAAGEANPEILRLRRMVHRIFGGNSGQQNGLYVNGKLSTDPEDIKAFKRAFAEKKVKGLRKETEIRND